MSQCLRILHLEDNPADAELIKVLLAKEGVSCKVTTVKTKGGFLAALEQERFDMIMSDYTLPAFDGLSALDLAKEKAPDCPFIFISGTLGEEAAVESLKRGATDYVLKDRLSRLGAVIRRALREAREQAERKRTEEQLRDSERRYRDLFEYNPHPMWVYDLETLAFLAVNDAAIDHYGYSRDEFLSMTIEQIRPEESVAALVEHLELRPPGLEHSEWQHRKKDGTIIDVEIVSHNLAFAGTPARLVLAHDITERKRAEETVEEQAALLDKARDAILVTDLEGRVQYWNKGAERLHGWTAKEVMGRNIKEFLYLEASWFPPAQEALLEKGEWTGEAANKTKASGEVLAQSHWSLVRDAKGRPKSILFINTDITERKRLEAQFLRAQRIETIGALAGGIAHDLNNALTPILMGVELLQEGQLQKESSDGVLKTIWSSARRGSEMVKQILAFSRGVAGVPTALDLKHLIREMTTLAEDTFPKSIEIRTVIAKQVHTVMGNATQLHQVLMNLCVNARDAMPRGGVLQVGAQNVELEDKVTDWQTEPVSGSYVRLTVSDTGEGMTSEVLNKVFEPFFTTKEAGKGTGLGLSTVQGIIKSHGGFVEVSSQVGKGTTFNVILPAVVTARVETTESERPKFPTGRGELILIIDDEIANLEMTRETLENFQYRVLMAKDGSEAVALFQRHKGEISAVISDMMMPLMDGPTTIQALQKIDPLVKTIGVSGLGSESVLIKAGKVRVDQFLKKPFSTEKLLTTLRSVLDAHASG